MHTCRLLLHAALLALGVTSVSPASLASDKPPAGVQATPPDGKVRLHVQRGADGTHMDLRNGLAVPVSVALELTRMVNVVGPGRRAIRQTVPAGSRVRLITLRKRQPGYPLMYTQAFRYTQLFSPEPGQAGSVGGHAYALPWQGGPFSISQGAGGDYSHNTPKGRYAVDIAMPPGTPVIAARSGTVIDTRNRQSGRWPIPSGNYVRIEHRDGSQSAYLHLQRGSVRVSVGQRIGVGSLLGKSGNTGRSTGPHLHFVVQQRVAGTLISVPFRFAQAVDAQPRVVLGER